MALGPPKSARQAHGGDPDPVVRRAARRTCGEFSEQGAPGRVFVGAKGATLRRTNFQAMWRKGVEAAGLPRVPVPRSAAHGQHVGGGQRGEPAGADGADGPRSTRAALIYLHALAER